MVFLEHRPRVYFSLTTAVEVTALFVQHVNGAIIVYHVTPPHGKKMAAIPDDCERTATVLLPTAASLHGLSADNHSSIATLDTFSTVFEPPLGRS